MDYTYDRGIFYATFSRRAGAAPAMSTQNEITVVSLTADDVRKVARLARLGLDEDAITGYATQLSSILEVVDHLGRADTGNVTPMSHPLDLSARLRPDIARPDTDREAFQAIAPDTASGLYRVPRVIE